MGTATRRSLTIRLLVAILVCVALLVPASARATGLSSHPRIKRGGIVTVQARISGSWVRNFNPGSATANSGTQGWLFAPLWEYNLAKGGKIMYWLAKGFKWSNGGRTLTIHLRPGLKWSDGKPLTSKDVVFSFNLAKKDKAFGFCGGCWSSGLKSVSAPNSTTIVLKLGQPNSTLPYYIGDSAGYVVPQHAWPKSGKPSTFTDPNPVDSGPFVVSSFSPQVYTFKRNPHFYLKGEPYVAGLRFPAYSSNDSADLAVLNGEVDWAGNFIPNAQKVYVGKAPGINHYWFPSIGAPVVLYLNMASAPFNNIHVRRAISLAVDRTAIGTAGEDGYASPANGPVVNTQFIKKWGNPAALRSVPRTADLTAAKAELAKAGSSIDLSKTYKLNVVDGWTDWVTSVTLVAQELSAIGMKVQVQPLQFGAWLSALQSGHYDFSIGYTTLGPSPFYLYRSIFWSHNSAPIGGTASSNWERYQSPAMDKLQSTYLKSTKTSVQVAAMKRMEGLVARDVPVVGLFWGPEWYEYNSKKFVGWPSAGHPYDQPPPWDYPSNMDVILHVHLR